MTGPRPWSIRWFEHFNLIAIAAGLVSVWLSWDAAVAQAAADGFGPGLLTAMIGTGYGVLLLLLWLISRQQNNIVKWIWAVLCLIGFVAGLADYRAMLADGSLLADYRAMLADGSLLAASNAIAFVLPVAALWLLFRRDARRWFGGRSEVDPNVFG